MCVKPLYDVSLLIPRGTERKEQERIKATMSRELQRVHSLLNMLQSDLERVMKANAILTRRVEQLEDEIPLSERMKMFDLDQETD